MEIINRSRYFKLYCWGNSSLRCIYYIDPKTDTLLMHFCQFQGAVTNYFYQFQLKKLSGRGWQIHKDRIIQVGLTASREQLFISEKINKQVMAYFTFIHLIVACSNGYIKNKAEKFELERILVHYFTEEVAPNNR